MLQWKCAFGECVVSSTWRKMTSTNHQEIQERCTLGPGSYIASIWMVCHVCGCTSNPKRRCLVMRTSILFEWHIMQNYSNAVAYELRGLSNLWNFKHADLSKTFFPSRRQFLFNWVPHHQHHIARGMLPHIATKCKFFFNNSTTTTKQASRAQPYIQIAAFPIFTFSGSWHERR